MTKEIESPLDNEPRVVSINKNRSELLYDKQGIPILYNVYHSETYRCNLWFKWDGKRGATRAKYELYKITPCPEGMCEWYEMGYSYGKDLKRIAEILLLNLATEKRLSKPQEAIEEEEN